MFVESGFRVVDCPALTCAGKNSADIHLVIDALDALASETRYDEFVLASTDADFAPLLHRLRAHDRRTTVLVGAAPTEAYRSVCDAVIPPDALVAGVRGGQHTSAEPAASALPAQRRTAGEQVQPAAVRAAADAVRTAVASSELPITSGAAAQAAGAASPGIAAAGWNGWGSFTAFVARHLPELEWTGKPSPGYVYDPVRQRMSDLRLPTG